MLTGVGSTATFALGLAFSGDTRGKGAFFAGFFLIVLVFLTVVAFLRVAALMPCFFLRLALPLAFFSCRHYNLPGRSLDIEAPYRSFGDEALSYFLERISRAQHGTILPMPSYQHHAHGQPCG